MGTAGKSIADFFAGAYIVGKLENHHTGADFLSRSSNISICNSKTTFNGLDVTDRDKLPWQVKTSTKVPVPFVLVGALGEELHGGVVGGVLVGVVEGFERQQSVGLRIATALEGVRDQPVGEFGVLGQRRPV